MRTLKFFGALALLGIVGCTTNGSAPTSFGVNLTIDGTGLTPATLKSITSLVVTVTGEKSPYSKTLAGSTIKGGTVHVEYIPGITSGSLVFEVNADNGSETVASGVTSSIAVVAGKATSATVKLASGEQVDMGVIPNGTPCAHDSDCTSATESGHCADGVCCDSACTDTCESCNLTGTVGTCTAIPVNTDPDNECGAITPTPPPAPPPPVDMAGVDLFGVAPPDLFGVDMATYNYPDGGVRTVSGQCAGSCNGSRACAYPGATKTCGTAFCNSSSVIETPTCDGAGNCTSLAPSSCVDYICGAGACKTRCISNLDCLDTDYCNVGTNSCVPKLPTGQQCAAGNQCQSGYCVGGTFSGNTFCCNSACANPSSCNDPAQPGLCECKVGGVPLVCPAGEGCNVFYKDGDNDTYGDQTQPQTACGNTPPTGYVVPQADASGNPIFDCDDANANAHPFQGTYFTTPRTNGTYDYNCDGLDSLQPSTGQTCTFLECLTLSSTCGTQYQQAYLDNHCPIIREPEPPLSKPHPELGKCDCSAGTESFGFTGVASNGKCGSAGNATYTDCFECLTQGATVTYSTGTGAQPCR